MLGSACKIFGGSFGAFVWTSVCRGCVGCNGSESMVCRGWNASAPRGACVLGVSFGAVGLEARIGGKIAGKSLAGSYQVISVRGASEAVCAGRIFQMGGG